LPLRVLERFPYVKDEGLIESYSRGGFVYPPSLDYKVESPGNEPIAAMILREKFDDGLVKLAIDSGATFRDGRVVEDVTIHEDSVSTKLTDGSHIESQIVIGADGAWSTVAKQSGLHQNHENMSIALVQEYPLSSKTLDTFFTEKRMCHIHMKLQGIAGYGWVFPKKQHLNIGISVFESLSKKSSGEKNLKEVFTNYIHLLKENNIIPDNLKIGKIKGAALPLYPLSKTFTDRCLLCGDAAGLINPVSGEGIYYAMASGEIAAGVIADAFNADEYSERFLSTYQKRWKDDFGKDIKLLMRFTKQWTSEKDKIVELASKDEKLTAMALGILHGGISIHEQRWKLARRYLYVYFKELFSK